MKIGARGLEKRFVPISAARFAAKIISESAGEVVLKWYHFPDRSVLLYRRITENYVVLNRFGDRRDHSSSFELHIIRRDAEIQRIVGSQVSGDQKREKFGVILNSKNIFDMYTDLILHGTKLFASIQWARKKRRSKTIVFRIVLEILRIPIIIEG